MRSPGHGALPRRARPSRRSEVRKGQEHCSPRGVLIGPYQSWSRNDREADHGEESEEGEVEDQIQESEKGRPGPQEEKGSGEKSRGEEGARQEGEAGPQACAKARSGAGPCAEPGPLLHGDPAHQRRRRRLQRRVTIALRARNARGPSPPGTGGKGPRFFDNEP